MASIVVIDFPSTAAIGSTHERVAWPSTWTVHAPHSEAPQPVLGARQADRVAQAPEERRVGFDVQVIASAVHLERDHGS